ncbi:MAG TPA: MotA/TolQ/ExbB proton channel family protein [Spirochaetota bacterium]|nr:MotA/TolQ/ExbB proton channel family protein [Spirochaetota bacterium]HNT09752.1 MotA/TolQ/ExbB proton channel family protein [Spirochaetota bacterium]
MFEGKTLWHIMQMGGFTILALAFCSVLSLSVIAERVYYFWKRSRAARPAFMHSLMARLGSGDIAGAQALCESTPAPFADVALAGIRSRDDSTQNIENAMDRQISIEVADLERYTAILGTIGSTAVYIGLFGTVLGIIHAFQDIAKVGGGGINIVIGGIAEALICTAAGISVAVPAVIAYNYLEKRIERFTTDMELCLSQLADFFTARNTAHETTAKRKKAKNDR